MNAFSKSIRMTPSEWNSVSKDMFQANFLATNCVSAFDDTNLDVPDNKGNLWVLFGYKYIY